MVASVVSYLLRCDLLGLELQGEGAWYVVPIHGIVTAWHADFV